MPCRKIESELVSSPEEWSTTVSGFVVPEAVSSAPPVPAEKFSLNTLTIVSGERIQATTLKRYENGDVEDVSANPHQPAPRPRTTTQPTPPRGSPQSPQAPREPSRDF